MSDAQEEKAGQVAVQTTETSDFASLLNKEFKPQSTRAREEVERDFEVRSHVLWTPIRGRLGGEPGQLAEDPPARRQPGEIVSP